MRMRVCTVPLNDKGRKEYNYGIEHTENMAEFFLDEAEFNTLYDGGIFDAINAKCGKQIDDYESEEISASELVECTGLLSGFSGTFMNAVNKAIEAGTFLALDF